MKKSFLILSVFAIALSSCNIRNNHKNGAEDTGTLVSQTDVKTNVKMIDSIYNFGKIKEGEKVVFSYRFQNTGEFPLVIASASASCGCTIPEKPEQPIAPGESGFIKVVFNSKGTGGTIHKEVHVTSNAQPDLPTLTLSGEVVAN